MRRLHSSIQVALLCIAGLLALGTSKTLVGKKLTTVRVTPTSAITVEPQASVWIRENVNNQGCFASQRLDFDASLFLHNTSPHTVRLKPAQVVLHVDEETYRANVVRLQPTAPSARKDSKGPPRGEPPPAEPNTLPAQSRARLVVKATAILPKKRLERIQRISLDVPLPPLGKVTVVFPDVSQRTVQRYR